MRQRRVNSYFTFLYPGYYPGGATPDKDAPCVAIPNSGEWVSVRGQRYGGEQPSAVFYDAQSLRDLAHVLEEAADLFEENQAKAKPNRRRIAALDTDAAGSGDAAKDGAG
jgi:hypothetical protein